MSIGAFFYFRTGRSKKVEGPLAPCPPPPPFRRLWIWSDSFKFKRKRRVRKHGGNFCWKILKNWHPCTRLIPRYIKVKESKFMINQTQGARWGGKRPVSFEWRLKPITVAVPHRILNIFRILCSAPIIIIFWLQSFSVMRPHIKNQLPGFIVFDRQVRTAADISWIYRESNRNC